MPKDAAQTATRRQFLAAGAGLATTAALAPAALATTGHKRAKLYARPGLIRPDRHQLEALRVLGRTQMRTPGSLPNPTLPTGTDTMPEIEHVVVVMMENHSYDNILGMLGRLPYQTPRGDGFTIGADGYPVESNPQADGTPLRAYQLPNTCQLSGHPSQDWAASHQQFDNGTNNGFVVSSVSPTDTGITNGPVTMGYLTEAQLPFTNSLAQTFPLGDRYFCSLLGQTLPNRRFLICGTSFGLTDNDSQNLAAVPTNGSIFNRLADAGVSFMEYYEQYPSDTSATMALSLSDSPYFHTNQGPMSAFYDACAAGTLPSFTLLDPNFGTQSEENPQNVVVGDAWLAGVVNAIGKSPNWSKTMLVVNYDEHGGYYDHVVPPVALAPDSVQPSTVDSEPTYDGFRRYGFRVPCVVVSPYAKPDYVSSVVYDHTSVLAFIERKWNLEAMTLRDANANDLTDFLDLNAMAAGTPAFPEFPDLAVPGDTKAALACTSAGLGTLPPARPASVPIEVRLLSRYQSGRTVAVEFQASRPGLGTVRAQLLQGTQRVATVRIGALTQQVRQARLHAPKMGTYTLELVHGSRVLLKRTVTFS
jgi:phospholipase C